MLGLFAATVAFGSDSDFGRTTYNGDRGQEVINLLTETTRTEYRWVRVPYNERVCRYETRYRQECRQEPGRRVCRTIPGQRVCRTRPDGRQICRNRPPTQQCRQQPGRRVCRQVPYQHQVCRTETRYRDERRPYTVVDQRTNAHVTFNFSHSLWETLGVNVELSAELHRDLLTVKAEDFSSPSLLLKDTVRRNRSGGTQNQVINEHHEITLVEANRLFAPMRGQIEPSEIYNNQLSLELEKVYYSDETSFALRISNNGREIFNRTLGLHEYSLVDDLGRSKLNINLANLIGSLPSGSQLVIDFTVQASPSLFLNSRQHMIGTRHTHSAES